MNCSKFQPSLFGVHPLGHFFDWTPSPQYPHQHFVHMKSECVPIKPNIIATNYVFFAHTFFFWVKKGLPKVEFCITARLRMLVLCRLPQARLSKHICWISRHVKVLSAVTSKPLVGIFTSSKIEKISHPATIYISHWRYHRNWIELFSTWSGRYCRSFKIHLAVWKKIQTK